MRSPSERAIQRGAIVLILALPGVFARAQEESGAVAAPASADAAAPAGPQPAPGRVEAPSEYRGAAVPLESTEIDGIFRQAEERFQASEWARGLAQLDEALALATQPPGKVRRKPPSEKKPAAEAGGGGGGMVRVRAIGGAVIAGRAGKGAPEEDFEIEPWESFLTKDGILFVPVARALRERLRDLPEEARAIHRRTYDAPARQASEKATQLPADRAINELKRVAERYPLTAAGLEAWRITALRLLGAGRAFEAGRALDARIALGADADDGTRAALLASAAAAYLEAAAPAQATARLLSAESKLPDAIVPIRGEASTGRDLKAHEYFRTGFERCTPRADLPLSWTSSRGRFDNAALERTIDLGAQLGGLSRWIHRLAPEEVQRNGRQAMPAAAGGRGASLGDRLYIRQDTDLVCLNAHTGKAHWRTSPADLSRESSRQDTRYGYYGEMGLENASSSVTIYEAARPGERTLAIVIPTPLKGANNQAGKPEFDPNLLVAYDALTGKLAWTAGRVESEWDPLRGLAFTAPPVVAAGLLLMPAVRGDSLFAVALTPQGKTRWVRRLYAYTAGQDSPYGGIALSGLPLVTRDGVVVAALGHGLVSAFDAASGSPLWASRYRSRIRHQYWSRRWISSAPVISGGRVVVFPSDSDFVTAFDVQTGELAWERQFPAEESPLLLGADARNAFVGTERVQALSLSDGKESWKSSRLSAQGQQVGGEDEDGSNENVYAYYYGPSPQGQKSVSSSVTAGGQLLAVTLDGTLTALDTLSGKSIRHVRIVDPKLKKPEPYNLFLAEGELLALGSTRLFAIEPQNASWKAAGEDESRFLGHRARLLRSEGRFDEALRMLEAQRASLKVAPLIEAAEREIAQTSRLAAAATGRPQFIRDLLDRAQPIIKDRAERISLCLLEASLLEKNGDLDAARAAYLKLASSDGIVARSPEDLEVDAGTYAADQLLLLKARAANGSPAQPPGDVKPTLPGAATDEVADRRDAVAFLRRPHLSPSLEAGRRLLERAESAGDSPRALGIARWLAETDPSFASGPSTESRIEKLDRAIAREPIAAGLAATLAGLKAAGATKLSQAYWISQDEGFLASSAVESEPVPALLAVCGTKLRLYGPDGAVITERALSEYPDISQVKISMESAVEEPAQLCARDGTVMLSTPAGLYGVQGVLAAESAASIRPRDVKIAWARTCPHPLLDATSSRRGWGDTFTVPGGRNFFAEASFAGRDPLVLLPGGSMYAVDSRTGKLTWRVQIEDGSPASPPEVIGPWIQVRLTGPAGIQRIRRDLVPGATPPPGLPRRRTVSDSDPNSTDVVLAGGGLVALFSGGQGVRAVESASNRLLWRTVGTAAQVAFATDTEAWLSEGSGKLVVRSLRSGRERRTIQIPHGSAVTEAFAETSGQGDPDGWTIVVSRQAMRRNYYYYSGRNQTGVDLILLRINARGEKAWEKEIHQGAVTYSGGRFLLPEGRFVLLFSGQVEEDKWYTRAVLVEPSGNFQEILTAEIHGKGTGQAPRLQVLKDGVALGNADGFGWYGARATAGAAPAKEPVKPGERG